MAIKNTGGPAPLGARIDTPTTDQLLELGTVAYGPNGRLYRYVQFLDAVTYLAGDVCTRAGGTIDQWKVTNDRAGGSNIAGHEVVGVLPTGLVAVPTQNQYGFVQIAGECAPRGTYVAGDQLKPHATLDGQAVVSGYASLTAADFNIFAIALSTTVARLSGLV